MLRGATVSACERSVRFGVRAGVGWRRERAYEACRRGDRRSPEVLRRHTAAGSRCQRCARSVPRASSRAMSLRTEIAEQPRVVRRLLDEGWPEARQLGRALARVDPITLVARGPSATPPPSGMDPFLGPAASFRAVPDR